MVKNSGLSLLEYALNFALSIQEIDKILVGVNSENQLKEIVQAVKKQGSLEAHPIGDINLLNPSLWKL
jgi:predicted aldo/keto reductase-like oxidoreductase